jgi:tRNA G37 N-methylase TrmD
MVDNAPFDEGNDGWDAVPAGENTTGGQPGMMMQSQEADDAFADAGFDNAQPIVVIQTASGAAQNLDDDLTEEEKVIVAEASAY